MNEGRCPILSLMLPVLRWLPIDVLEVVTLIEVSMFIVIFHCLAKSVSCGLESVAVINTHYV